MHRDNEKTRGAVLPASRFPLLASRFSRVLVLAAVLLLPCHSPGAMMFGNGSEARLSNGLKVIMLEDHKAPVVCFQVWYRAGAANEATGKTGLAHMVEHMMFKGAGGMSGEKFIKTVHELGGTENAATSHDHVFYYEALPSNRTGGAIQFEADRMRNLKINESDFRTEKMVVLEERRMRIDDNPVSFLLEQLYAAAFQSEPYHWPVIGWTDDIRRLTIGDARDFYSKYYVPANAFIVVTGDFKKEVLLPRLEDAFGKIPPGEPAPRYLLEDPPQQGERRVSINRPARVGRLFVAWHVPNLRSDDAYALEVMKAILSLGKSSRLYDSLVRQDGVALETSAHYDLTSRDPGLFYISASFLPEKDPGEVEKAIFDQLSLLGKTRMGNWELQKAKNLLEASFVLDHQSILSRGIKLAEYEIAFDWTSASAYIPSIRSVTAQDVQRVAAKYFTAPNRTVGILVPEAPPAKKVAGEGD